VVEEEEEEDAGAEEVEREGSFGRGVDRLRVTKLLSFTVESSVSECGETGEEDDDDEDEDEGDKGVERSSGARLRSSGSLPFGFFFVVHNLRPEGGSPSREERGLTTAPKRFSSP